MAETHKVLPFIYTPTVGEACSRYFELMQRVKVGGCAATPAVRASVWGLARQAPRHAAPEAEGPHS